MRREAAAVRAAMATDAGMAATEEPARNMLGIMNWPAPEYRRMDRSATCKAVSYTHLDVYKRQALRREGFGTVAFRCAP